MSMELLLLGVLKNNMTITEEEKKEINKRIKRGYDFVYGKDSQ